MEVLHTIDIRRLWRIVRKRARVFVLVEAAAIVLALVYGFSIHRTYRAQMKLAPETSSSGISGNIGSMASMLGMKIGNMSSNDAISPELYPDVKSSPDFLLGLFDVKVRTLDGKVSTDYKTYLTRYTHAPWWEVLLKKLNPLKRKKDTPAQGAADTHALCLNKKDFQLMKGVDGLISCTVDKKTDVITISVVDQDPLVAALMVDSVRTRLQDFITNYRTKKARNDAAHLEQLFEKARKDYRKAQAAYAAYSDAHQEIFLESYKQESENLENEMQVAYNVYSQISVQLQMAKAKILERTPAFTVVEAPLVPVRHIAPRRSVILLMGMFLAFVGTFVWAYGKESGEKKNENGRTEHADGTTTRDTGEPESASGVPATGTPV